MRQRINNFKIGRLAKELKEQAKPDLELLKEVNQLNKEKIVTKTFRDMQLDKM
jgi:hypothetical protein